jgi:hypothetical protein
VVGKAAFSWQEQTNVIIVATRGHPTRPPARRIHAGGTAPPGRCVACRTTQVLLPSSLLSRRADAAEVIGTALLAKARGRGWRRIAADLRRPPATVPDLLWI